MQKLYVAHDHSWVKTLWGVEGNSLKWSGCVRGMELLHQRVWYLYGCGQISYRKGWATRNVWKRPFIPSIRFILVTDNLFSQCQALRPGSCIAHICTNVCVWIYVHVTNWRTHFKSSSEKPHFCWAIYTCLFPFFCLKLSFSLFEEEVSDASSCSHSWIEIPYSFT